MRLHPLPLTELVCSSYTSPKQLRDHMPQDLATLNVLRGEQGVGWGVGGGQAKERERDTDIATVIQAPPLTVQKTYNSPSNQHRKGASPTSSQQSTLSYPHTYGNIKGCSSLYLTFFTCLSGDEHLCSVFPHYVFFLYVMKLEVEQQCVLVLSQYNCAHQERFPNLGSHLWSPVEL